MAEESFYGVTLKGKNSVVEWDVPNDEECPRGQKLIIKQILLGWEAAEGEFNVVEVHTVKDGVKIPLAVLKAGETRSLNPDVEFYDTSVTFKLIEGNGPVHIHGTHLKDEVEVIDMMDEDTDEEDEPEEDEDEGQPKKKLKMENNSDRAKNNKKK